MAPVLAEAGANRVVHDVPSDGLRVTIALDDACIEPVLEEMPGALVSLVKPHGVEAIEAMHARGEPNARGRDHQMKVIGHQAKGPCPPGKAVPGISEETEKRAVVVVVEEDFGPSDTPCRYMERAVSQEMSWAARHDPKVEQKIRALEARAHFDTHR